MNACPEGALTLGERIDVDRTRCTLCGRCVDACPAAAMSVQGRSIGAQEAAELSLPVLAQLPFDAKAAQLCDEGNIESVDNPLMADAAAAVAGQVGL